MITVSRVVSHIQNFGDLLKEMPHLLREMRNLLQETRSFSTGDVSSPLEIHILRTHAHIPRRKCRISRVRHVGISKILDMWHCWTRLCTSGVDESQCYTAPLRRQDNVYFLNSGMVTARCETSQFPRLLVAWKFFRYSQIYREIFWSF